MESIGLSVEALQKILAPEIAHQALAAATAEAQSALARGSATSWLPREHHAAQPEQARDVIAQQYEGDEQALALLNETLAEIDARVPTSSCCPRAA
jgi:hypothetical protein